MKVINAIYYFIVGDMIILIGVLAVIVILALINNIDALAVIRPATGYILILAVLGVLIATLSREARGNR